MALTDNLVAYYKMEESGSSNRVDSTVNALDLTAGGAGMGRTGGVVNNCATFDGASWLQHTNNSNFYMGGHDTTIQAWAYLTSVGGAAQQGIISMYSGVAQGYVIYWNGTADNHWKFYTTYTTGSPVYTIVSDPNATASGTWYHLICQYIVGVKVRMKVNNGSWIETAETRTFQDELSANFSLGRTDNGALRMWLTGRIDEVGVWQRALSDAEITQLYNGGAGLTYPFTGTAGGHILTTRHYW